MKRWDRRGRAVTVKRWDRRGRFDREEVGQKARGQMGLGCD